MKPAYKRALLALLLFGTWLPVTITCDPGYWNDLVTVVEDGWRGDVVVDDGCGCWWGDCCW